MRISGLLLEPKKIKKTVDEFKQVITTNMSRKRERTERSRSEDFDAEEGELLQEENSEEELVFDQVSYMQQLQHFLLGARHDIQA